MEEVMLFAEGGIVVDSTWALGLFMLLIGAVGGMFKIVMSSKDAQIEELKAKNKILDASVSEATGTLLGVANYYRTTFEKLPPIIPLAPVIPNSNSPSTQKQRDEAELETRKALLAAIRLATHQDAKPEPPQAIEIGVGIPTPSLPAVSAEIRDHTQKLDEKVDVVLADVKDIKQVVVVEDNKGKQ